MNYVICRGSLMDGVDINILTWCGLSELSNIQEERLWEEIGEIELFENCHSCEVIETSEIDEMPGQSDVFIKVVTTDVDTCKNEMRSAIMKRIEGVNS
jgi:hypothetical protein